MQKFHIYGGDEETEYRLNIDKARTLRGKIEFLSERCKACGFCIEFCPMDVLEVSDEINKKGYHPPKMIDESRCILCGVCEDICPDFAIFIKKSEEEKNLDA